jgi:hypothetical protein
MGRCFGRFLGPGCRRQRWALAWLGRWATGAGQLPGQCHRRSGGMGDGYRVGEVNRLPGFRGGDAAIGIKMPVMCLVIDRNWLPAIASHHWPEIVTSLALDKGAWGDPAVRTIDRVHPDVGALVRSAPNDVLGAPPPCRQSQAPAPGICAVRGASAPGRRALRGKQRSARCSAPGFAPAPRWLAVAGP